MGRRRTNILDKLINIYYIIRYRISFDFSLCLSDVMIWCFAISNKHNWSEKVVNWKWNIVDIWINHMKQISPNMNFILANNEETAKDTHTSGTIGVLQLVLVPPRTNFSVLVVTKYSHKPFELKWNSLQHFHMPSSSLYSKQDILHVHIWARYDCKLKLMPFRWIDSYKSFQLN